MRVECKNPQAVVMEAMFLAYQACGGPVGMGILQARGNVTKEQVWDNCRRAGDYPGGELMRRSKPGEVYGDYVFGRMMKCGFRWNETGIEVPEDTPRLDYQSWCRRYPTYAALIEAAMKSVESDPVPATV